MEKKIDFYSGPLRNIGSYVLFGEPTPDKKLRIKESLLPSFSQTMGSTATKIDKMGTNP